MQAIVAPKKTDQNCASLPPVAGPQPPLELLPDNHSLVISNRAINVRELVRLNRLADTELLEELSSKHNTKVMLVLQNPDKSLAFIKPEVETSSGGGKQIKFSSVSELEAVPLRQIIKSQISAKQGLLGTYLSPNQTYPISSGLTYAPPVPTIISFARQDSSLNPIINRANIRHELVHLLIDLHPKKQTSFNNLGEGATTLDSEIEETVRQTNMMLSDRSLHKTKTLADQLIKTFKLELSAIPRLPTEHADLYELQHRFRLELGISGNALGQSHQEWLNSLYSSKIEVVEQLRDKAIGYSRSYLSEEDLKRVEKIYQDAEAKLADAAERWNQSTAEVVQCKPR